MAKFSKEIIRKLNTEQLSSLQQSLKEEASLWKQSFKFIEKGHNQIGPNYVADNFGLPEESKIEPCWVHSRREFLKILPPEERNILLTGDPDKAFDPFSYIWCYSYPNIAARNPILLQYFQHILGFENNVENQPEVEQPQLLPPAPNIPKKRGRPLGSKNKPKIQSQNQDNLALPALQPSSTTAPSRSRRLKRTIPKQNDEALNNLDSVCTVENNDSRTSSPNGQWTLVEYRKSRPTRTSGHISKDRRICNRCGISPRTHPGTLGSPNPNSRPGDGNHKQVCTQRLPRNPNALSQGQPISRRGKSKGIRNVINSSEPICDEQLRSDLETNQNTNRVSNRSSSTITDQVGQTIRVHIWACRNSLCNGECNQNISNRKSRPTESKRISHPDTHCRDTREPSEPPGPKIDGQRTDDVGSIEIQSGINSISSQQPGISNYRCSQNSISNSTTSTNEQAFNRPSTRANDQQNVHILEHGGTTKGPATFDQETSGFIPNRTVLLLPPGRQSIEPIFACSNGTPEKPAAVFPIGAFSNRKLHQEQYINDAKCQGGPDCCGGRAPIPVGEPNRPTSMSVIRDIVPVLGQTHNQNRPGGNMFGSLLSGKLESSQQIVSIRLHPSKGTCVQDVIQQMDHLITKPLLNNNTMQQSVFHHKPKGIINRDSASRMYNAPKNA